MDQRRDPRRGDRLDADAARCFPARRSSAHCTSARAGRWEFPPIEIALDQRARRPGRRRDRERPALHGTGRAEPGARRLLRRPPRAHRRRAGPVAGRDPHLPRTGAAARRRGHARKKKKKKKKKIRRDEPLGPAPPVPLEDRGRLHVADSKELTPLQEKALEHGATVLALELVKERAPAAGRVAVAGRPAVRAARRHHDNPSLVARARRHGVDVSRAAPDIRRALRGSQPMQTCSNGCGERPVARSSTATRPWSALRGEDVVLAARDAEPVIRSLLKKNSLIDANSRWASATSTTDFAPRLQAGRRVRAARGLTRGGGVRPRRASWARCGSYSTRPTSTQVRAVVAEQLGPLVAHEGPRRPARDVARVRLRRRQRRRDGAGLLRAQEHAPLPAQAPHRGARPRPRRARRRSSTCGWRSTSSSCSPGWGSTCCRLRREGVGERQREVALSHLSRRGQCGDPARRDPPPHVPHGRVACLLV